MENVLKQFQERKIGRMLGLNFATPRKVVDKNVVLNFWPQLYYKICPCSPRQNYRKVPNVPFKLSNETETAITICALFLPNLTPIPRNPTVENIGLESLQDFKIESVKCYCLICST